MKGILFKLDMIQAIAEGRKTQTRRIIKIQPYDNTKYIKYDPDLGVWWFSREEYDQSASGHKPRFQVGETVYLKEAYAINFKGQLLRRSEYDFLNKLLELDKHYPMPHIKWETPLFMPEKYARYFIKIKSVTPQRLHKITEEDAIAEGVMVKASVVQGNLVSEPTFRDSFAMLWDSINKTYPWDKNWWVWKYCFELVALNNQD